MVEGWIAAQIKGFGEKKLQGLQRAAKELAVPRKRVKKGRAEGAKVEERIGKV
jgi:hypothetical protein